MEDVFTSFDELCDNIERGGEIEFRHNGKHYSITHSPQGIHVMEAYNYDSEKVYKAAKEVGEYIIDNNKIKDIVKELYITFRCF